MNQKVNRFFPILCKYFVILLSLAAQNRISLPFCMLSIDKYPLMLYNIKRNIKTVGGL